MNKRIVIPAAIVVTVAVVMTVLMLSFPGELEGESFDQTAFAEAKADGKTVLVDFAASWCPTCKKQGPVIESVLTEDRFHDVVAFKANYDKEKDLKRQLGVLSQSTLVVFKGQEEVGRATGITDKTAIAELLAKGL